MGAMFIRTGLYALPLLTFIGTVAGIAIAYISNAPPQIIALVAALPVTTLSVRTAFCYGLTCRTKLILFSMIFFATAICDNRAVSSYLSYRAALYNDPTPMGHITGNVIADAALERLNKLHDMVLPKVEQSANDEAVDNVVKDIQRTGTNVQPLHEHVAKRGVDNTSSIKAIVANASNHHAARPNQTDANVVPPPPDAALRRPVIQHLQRERPTKVKQPAVEVAKSNPAPSEHNSIDAELGLEPASAASDLPKSAINAAALKRLLKQVNYRGRVMAATLLWGYGVTQLALAILTSQQCRMEYTRMSISMLLCLFCSAIIMLCSYYISLAVHVDQAYDTALSQRLGHGAHRASSVPTDRGTISQPPGQIIWGIAKDLVPSTNILFIYPFITVGPMMWRVWASGIKRKNAIEEAQTDMGDQGRLLFILASVAAVCDAIAQTAIVCGMMVNQIYVVFAAFIVHVVSYTLMSFNIVDVATDPTTQHLLYKSRLTNA